MSESPAEKIFRSVRAVGFIKPAIKPQVDRVFADSLQVMGTAFWLKEYKLLVTCMHVVQDLLGQPPEAFRLLVVGNHGNYTRALIDSIDFNHDLAILKLPNDVPQTILDTESGTGLEIASENPTVGTQVGYAGFPLGTQLMGATHAPTFSQGIVASEIRIDNGRKNIQISGPVAGGFSGSPIVSIENGKLLGVLSNSPSREAGAAGIFMATSWAHVRALAEMAVS